MEDDDGQYIGKYANLWVRYTRILFEVHTAEKLKVLHAQCTVTSRPCVEYSALFL